MKIPTGLIGKILGGLSVIMISLSFVSPSHAATSRIGVVVFDGFLTSDVTAAVEVFGAASKKAWFSSYEVVLVSSNGKYQIRSEEGLTVVADELIESANMFDALIIPSAYDMSLHLANVGLIKFIQKHHLAGAWMASNCSGAMLLGEAGVLDNKAATTWAGGEAKLAQRYTKANVVFDQNVVVDDKLITSNGGPVSYEGALALLTQLSSEDYSVEISDSIQFSRIKKTR